MSTTTANMGLTIPSSGDSDYPTSISDSLTAVDLHDHTSGKGIPVGRLATAAADGTTLEVSSGAVRIKDLGVSTAKIAANAVTRAKLEAVGQQAGSSSGSQSLTSLTYVDLNNLTVAITTTGRPVIVALMPVETGGDDDGYLSLGGASFATAYLKLLRDATSVARWTFRNNTELGDISSPPSSVFFLDTPAAGTYTYKLQGRLFANADSQVFTYDNVKLIAWEL